MGFIRATGGQGTRKQEIEVAIRDETGNDWLKVVGEVETLCQDKRRIRKRRDYCVLTRLSETPRLDIIYNLSTHLVELRHSGGVHYWYIPLDWKISVPILAASQLLLEHEEGEASPELLEQWFKTEFKNKINAAMKRRFQAWRLRRASLNRGAPPAYKPPKGTHRRTGKQCYH